MKFRFHKVKGTASFLEQLAERVGRSMLSVRAGLLIDEYYNYFIAIEPDSEEYLIAPQLQGLIAKIRDIYGDQNIKMTAFRLNERGTCGMI